MSRLTVPRWPSRRCTEQTSELIDYETTAPNVMRNARNIALASLIAWIAIVSAAYLILR